MCCYRPGGKDAGPADRDSHAMPSGSGAGPSAVPTSDSSSDSDSTSTAAAPAYPSDASTSKGSSTPTGRVPSPPPPPPSAPRQAHAEYQKLLQQRHRDRLNLHKNQVGLMFCQSWSFLGEVLKLVGLFLSGFVFNAGFKPIAVGLSGPLLLSSLSVCEGSVSWTM